jgi:hypothetical protein
MVSLKGRVGTQPLRPKAVVSLAMVELEIKTGGADSGNYACELLDRLQSCRLWTVELETWIPRKIATLQVRG